MLYALRTPTAFVALLAGFLLGVVVHVVAQRLVARTRHGQHTGIGARRRTSVRDTLWSAVDPFGAVAAALGGTGWARSPELPPRRRRGWGRSDLVLLAGPAANLTVAAAALLVYRAVGGPGVATVASLPDLLHGQVTGLPVPVLALLLVGVQNLAMGLLALVPMPPLDGGRLLFAHAPRTSGWQRAEYYLAEHNWGVAVLLVLLLLPIAGEAPLLLVLLDLVGRPPLGLLTGG